MAATETALAKSSIVAHWLTTATGATSAITVYGGALVDIAIDFGALTDAIVTLEVETRTKLTATIGDPAWQTMKTYTSGDNFEVLRIASTRRFRLNCTSHGTTGTITAEVTGGDRVA
jgi:hypothetical protein